MKNLFLVLSVVMVLFAATGSAQANNIPPTNKADELAYIKNLIDKNIDYPYMCDQFECGLVKAQFIINRDQTIDVVAINGEPELTTYVKNQLKQVSVAYPRLIGRQFICKFDFRSA